MLHKKKNRPAAARRSHGHAVPLILAALVTGCAEGSLETASLDVSQPSWTPQTAAADSSVTKSPLPPVSDSPAASDDTVIAAGPSLSPETASAIRDARALREAGNKSRALGILEKTAGADKDPALLLERGLLTLELGQPQAAEELLKQAHDPKAPDWRQYSGLGASLSAQGKQQAAQAEFAKALALAPDNTSVLNNLALSYALDGKHAEAERLLRQAAEHGGGNPKARQNLALILGLRGNVEEAKRVSETVLPPEKVKSNVAYLEQLRSGGQQVSRAEKPAVEEVRAVAQIEQAPRPDEPIMQLGSSP